MSSQGSNTRQLCLFQLVEMLLFSENYLLARLCLKISGFIPSTETSGRGSYLIFIVVS